MAPVFSDFFENSDTHIALRGKKPSVYFLGEGALSKKDRRNIYDKNEKNHLHFAKSYFLSLSRHCFLVVVPDYGITGESTFLYAVNFRKCFNSSSVILVIDGLGYLFHLVIFIYYLLSKK